MKIQKSNNSPPLLLEEKGPGVEVRRGEGELRAAPKKLPGLNFTDFVFFY